MIAVITGVGGLVGSEAALHFASDYTILGIDNDMRGRLFDTSIVPRLMQVQDLLGDHFHYHPWDIRHGRLIEGAFKHYGQDIALVIHAAAQPSHDYAASDPILDFDINARSTLVLLEATRQYAPEATFIFCSTNKVYGDRPNILGYFERETRYEMLVPSQRLGIDETLPVDDSLHSLFGASKLAADILVQEYGRYFGMNTVCFRAGCLTGPHHAGAEQHGFLAYLMKCVQEGLPYTVYGYKGKQVRDNLHAHDLIRAFALFADSPRPGAVYNIGGGRDNSLSVLEAISLCEAITGQKLEYTLTTQARKGDHRWWITDTRRFQSRYDWAVEIGLEEMLTEMARVPA